MKSISVTLAILFFVSFASSEYENNDYNDYDNDYNYYEEEHKEGTLCSGYPKIIIIFNVA